MAFSYLGKEALATDALSAYRRLEAKPTPLRTVTGVVTRFAQDALRYRFGGVPKHHELRTLLPELSPTQWEVFVPAWAYLFNGALTPQISEVFGQDFSMAAVIQDFNRAVTVVRDPIQRDRRFPLLREDLLEHRMPPDTTREQLNLQTSETLREALIRHKSWRPYFETEAALTSLEPVRLLLVAHIPANRLAEFMPAILETGQEISDATQRLIETLGLRR